MNVGKLINKLNELVANGEAILETPVGWDNYDLFTKIGFYADVEIVIKHQDTKDENDVKMYGHKIFNDGEPFVLIR
jgi:hypothetical protein